ncbi:MAG: MarC family protein [Thermodesulfovibrionales bacterium]
MEYLGYFLLTVIPLMVAIDAPGVLPLYLAVTEHLEPQEKRRIARHSVFTAFIITVLFIFLGRAIFRILGILVEDFMIAGGVLLLIISISELSRAGTQKMTVSPTFGVVPLGTPLLGGPATITTSLLLAGNYGPVPVIISLILNLLLAWFIFDRADFLIRRMGMNGVRVITRMASLLLAAIAVKMIRVGVFTLISQWQGGH